MTNFQRYLHSISDLHDHSYPLWFLEGNWQDAARLQLLRIRKILREAEKAIESEAAESFR